MGKGISTNMASEILNAEPTALLDLFILQLPERFSSSNLFSWWNKWDIKTNCF